MNRMLICSLILIAASLLFAAPASAQQYTIYYWNPTGSDNNFNTPANWTWGQPGDIDPTLLGGKVFWVQGTTPVEITAAPIYPPIIYTIPVMGGTVNQSGGDVVVTPYQTITGGGAYNMTGGTYWAKGMEEFFSIGRLDGSGTLNVSGGNFKIDPSTVYGWGISMTIANPNQATGTVSGTATVSNAGVIDCQTGFVSLCTNGVLNIGDQTNTGVGGGTLKAWNLIGEYYYGTTGGGVLNFDGGTLAFTRDASPGYLFFELSQVNLNTYGGTIEVPAGLTAASNAANGVAPISGVGGLTKTGAGTLILDGTNNTYAGPTVIQQGTLTLNDAGIASAAITVKSGGTLGGRYTNVTLPAYPVTTVESSGSIAPGTPGQTFYISDVLLANGSNLNFTFSALGDAVDTITANTVASIGGGPITVNVNYANNPANAVTPLMYGAIASNITFSLSGGVPVLDSPDGVSAPATLDASSGWELDLIKGGILADSVPGWNDAGGGSWTEDSKWANNVAPIVNQHPDGGGDRGLFIKDLGGSAIPISLNISPRLSSMVFASPNGESYTITPSASGKTITLDSGIAQNWHITVLGGSHTVGADMRLGAGTGTFAGQSAIRLVDYSQLTLSGVLSDETVPAGVNFVGDFNGGTGTGVLTLQGANTFTGPVVVKNGILEITSIGDANTPNPLGKSDPAPANFKLAGTLRYLGADAAPSSNRGFTTTAAVGAVSRLEIQNAGTNLTLSGQARNVSGGLIKAGPGAVTFANSGADNVLAAEDFNIIEGGAAFHGGTASVYQVGGNLLIDAASSLSVSSGKLQTGGYIQAQNGSTETISGSSQVTAMGGFGAIVHSSITLSNTATIFSGASIGVHEGSVLTINSTGVLPDDPDGYTVKSSDKFAVGFNTPGTTGAVNIAAGKVYSPILWLGNESGNLGSLNISGNGTFVTTAAALGSTISIAAGGGGVGYASITGGTFKCNYALDPIYLGVGGDGLIDVSAGTLDCSTPNVGLYHPGDAMWIGGAPGIAGILNVRGTGSVTNTTNVIRLRGSYPIINVGVSGDAHGVMQAAAFVPAPQEAGSETRVGVINFHGGTLTATVDADGVTIPAGGTTPNPVLIGNGVSDVAHVYIHAEGAKIDTNGHNVVIDCPLEAPATGGVHSTSSGTPYSVPMASGGNGSGYITTPYVKVLDGDGTGPGTNATAIAVMSTANPGQVDHIQITNPGVGYANPTFTLVGGLGSDGIAATIDIAQVTTGENASGGLTKLGTGMLTLTSVPTYTGDTSVYVGDLTLPSLNTPSAVVTVYDGGTLNAGSVVADTLTIGGTAPSTATAVPEPGTFALLIVALAVIAGLRWKRK